jgi:hypothetical protein
MNKTVTLNFYSTPSHGYLQVHKNLLNEIASCKATNSGYSFYNAKAGLFYFEEDCDAPEVLTALRNAGYEVNLVEQYDEHETIKSYRRLS